MTIADDCRKWAVVMYRAATSIEEDQDLSKTPDIVCVIDSHRALADTISKAADEIDRLNRERDAAVCEGATIGHMSATADAQERERRLREALRIIADADVREMGRAGACTLSAIAREALGDE